MLRTFGTILIATSLIVGVVLTITGDIGEITKEITHHEIAGISIADVNYVMAPNWWTFGPLVFFLLAGIGCLIIRPKTSK